MVVENATKYVTIVKSDTTNSRSLFIYNKSQRLVTVRIEESVNVDNFLQKRTMIFRKINPNEKRFIGIAGCDHFLMQEKCKGYKLLIAYYEDNVILK
jgi:hypothetical protein